MALPPIRAILVVGYNILRTLCRKYGLYLCIGATVLFIHSYSGYGDNEAKTHSSADPQNMHSDEILLEKELAILESQVYEKIGRNQGDSHSKYPPGTISNKPKQHLASEVQCPPLNKEAASALQRATTDLCKQRITNISCQVERGTFYPDRLVSYCPSNGQVRGRFLGCYMDLRNARLLRGHVSQQKQNSPLLCTDHCYARGYVHAGLQYGKECFCGNEEVASQHLTSDAACDMPCPGAPDKSCGGYLTMSLYQTGLAKTGLQPAVVGSSSAVAEVRIAYILTVHGRAVRQLYRLFRALYHDRHYFYIHVDVRASLMYRAALVLAERYSNVAVTETRHATIWGGSTLLTVLLQAMKDLTSRHDYHWDFVINLSESDYPIKTNTALDSFLAWNKGRNFLKSHGQDTNRFLRKQGLDRTFLQCEQHMWRLGERQLPSGVRVDGGSDWVCLSAPFVRYVVGEDDQLLRGLRQVYEHTLLPAESFFHTVLRNSAFCQSFTDNNLHLTNWRRKQGCRCQYKHIVDWCGCSPNDFTTQDWNKLLATRSRNLFFGRKFEAVVSLSIINRLDAWLYGPYREDTPSLHSYWENRYHQLDPPSASQDTHRTLYLAAARLAAHAVNRAAAAGTRAAAVSGVVTSPATQAEEQKRSEHLLAGKAGREESHQESLGSKRLGEESKKEDHKRRLERSAEKPHSSDETHPEEGQHGASWQTLNYSCVVSVGAVLQAHTFHQRDQYKGVVVEAVTSVPQQSVFLFESWLVPLPSATTILKPDILQDMQVGSDFDLKEQMFRNLEGALGPQSAFSVALRHPPDQQDAASDGQSHSKTGADQKDTKGKEKGGPQRVLVLVLVDPLQMVADAVQVNVDSVDAHQLVNFSPSTPLRPGRWRVYAVSGSELAAQTTFPVLPLAYHMARELTVMEARSLHSGPPDGRYTSSSSSVDPSSYLSALPEPPVALPLPNRTTGNGAEEVEAAQSWAEKHSQRYGAALSDWINEVVLSAWTVSSTCYVSSPHVPACVRDHVQPCHRAPWSTRFPDPKSELTAPDPATGYLLDPYRTVEQVQDSVGP